MLHKSKMYNPKSFVAYVKIQIVLNGTRYSYCPSLPLLDRFIKHFSRRILSDSSFHTFRTSVFITDTKFTCMYVLLSSTLTFHEIPPNDVLVRPF